MKSYQTISKNWKMKICLYEILNIPMQNNNRIPPVENSNHNTTAIITTILRIFLIGAAIGTYVLIAHNSIPTTTRVIITDNSNGGIIPVIPNTLSNQTTTNNITTTFSICLIRASIGT